MISIDSLILLQHKITNILNANICFNILPCILFYFYLLLFIFIYFIRVATVLKIEEIFQVISINYNAREHSLMTWKNLRVLNCDQLYSKCGHNAIFLT